MKDNIHTNKMLRSSIEQWPVRIRKAGKKNQDLAKEAGISDAHLSQIINFKISKPRLATLNLIEGALEKWGV